LALFAVLLLLAIGLGSLSALGQRLPAQLHTFWCCAAASSWCRDDIKGCALAVLRHRVRLSPELDIEGLSVDQVLQQLLDQVPAPRV
ncbi:hypothetical protein ACXKGW_29620, partial [Klebsiella pneumoniae subsp. pneumoniae]